MLDRIITYSFYLLFFLTPLFWTSKNYELFEFNKMLLTYGFTVVIVGSWLLKIINHKSLIFNRTPLDIPLLLFLGANILSTVFSIDRHVSIWGYYSRLNGGLLSIISYLLLYWAFVSNFEASKIKRLFHAAFLSAAVISIWGILEHFGVSPSCVILRGEFNASCWVQDVQSRVFATLGQPNWMAAYLSMLIFPALYFLLAAKKNLELGIWYLVLLVYYLSFTFTYSRGPTLGLIGGMIVFLIYYLFLPYFHRISTIFPLQKFIDTLGNLIEINRKILIVLGSFLAINLLFGSALTNFRLISQFAAPPRPNIALPPSGVTQLENGGTESGQIRFIVWQGALDIFRHYPIFGSGVETFAYSYYQFRPIEHNLTSEWDFLYNKAHNEYLNYLATTGIVGFGAYILMIGTFLIWCIKKLLESSRKSQESRSSLLDSRLLTLVTLSAYISYLIYNFFLFSVVIIALFFYLFPAIAFVATENTKAISYQLSAIRWLYKRSLYTKAAKGLVIFSILYLLFSIFQLWYADSLFSQGQRATDAGNPGRSYNLLTRAVALRASEPFYLSELSYAAASAAVALQELGDASSSAALKDESVLKIEGVLRSNPHNVSFWRTAIRTYFELSSLDKKYLDETLKSIEQAINLAPTDPKLYYNKALILQSEERTEEAIEALEKAILLKPNYIQAIEQLKDATSSASQ